MFLNTLQEIHAIACFWKLIKREKLTTAELSLVLNVFVSNLNVAGTPEELANASLELRQKLTAWLESLKKQQQ